MARPGSSPGLGLCVELFVHDASQLLLGCPAEGRSRSAQGSGEPVASIDPIPLSLDAVEIVGWVLDLEHRSAFVIDRLLDDLC
jgi:hypothetical protein